MPNHGNPASTAFARLKPKELHLEPAAFLAQSVVIKLNAVHISPHFGWTFDRRMAKQVYCVTPRVEAETRHRGYFATG